VFLRHLMQQFGRTQFLTGAALLGKIGCQQEF
jgi:hypothetical protein